MFGLFRKRVTAADAAEVLARRAAAAIDGFIAAEREASGTSQELPSKYELACLVFFAFHASIEVCTRSRGSSHIIMSRFTYYFARQRRTPLFGGDPTDIKARLLAYAEAGKARPNDWTDSPNVPLPKVWPDWRVGEQFAIQCGQPHDPLHIMTAVKVIEVARNIVTGYFESVRLVE